MMCLFRSLIEKLSLIDWKLIRLPGTLLAPLGLEGRESSIWGNFLANLTSFNWSSSRIFLPKTWLLDQVESIMALVVAVITYGVMVSASILVLAHVKMLARVMSHGLSAQEGKKEEVNSDSLCCWYFSSTKTFFMSLLCLEIFGYMSRVPCSNNKWFHVTWFSVMTLAPSFEHLLMVPVLFSPDYWSARWCFHFPWWSLPASFIPRSATGNSFPEPP